MTLEQYIINGLPTLICTIVFLTILYSVNEELDRTERPCSHLDDKYYDDDYREY